MKKLIFIVFNLLVCLLLQTKIYTNEICNFSKENNHNYDEIEHLTIEYENIFKQEEKQYFVYFYSLSCRHCYELKNDIIGYALCNKVRTYFVLECDKIKYGYDTNLTIGSDNIELLFIKGYPTLIEINDYVLSFN